MNGVLFLVLITILSLVSSLFTEAVKNACKNANKAYSANLIALINGLVIGAGGVIAAYLLLGIAFMVASVLVADLIISIVLGVVAFSSFWSILEIFQQHKRVKKGWFPAGPGHKR